MSGGVASHLWHAEYLEQTNVAVASSPSMLRTVAIEHGDQSLSDRQRGLNVDDSRHWQQDIHQQSTHSCFDLLTRAV